MSIPYEVIENPLTHAFSARAFPRDTITTEQLATRLANRGVATAAEAQAILTVLAEEFTIAITSGNEIELDGIGTFAASITGVSITNPTDPLPATTRIGVNYRMNKVLRAAMADAGTERHDTVEPIPSITDIQGLFSANPNAATATDTFEIAGNHLKLFPDATGQGLFLVKPDGTTLTVTRFQETGDRRLQFALPAGVAAGVTYDIELRARRSKDGKIRIGRLDDAITMA